MFCTPSHFTAETKPYFADSMCKYGSLLMHTKVSRADPTDSFSDDLLTWPVHADR